MYDDLLKEVKEVLPSLPIQHTDIALISIGRVYRLIRLIADEAEKKYAPFRGITNLEAANIEDLLMSTMEIYYLMDIQPLNLFLKSLSSDENPLIRQAAFAHRSKNGENFSNNEKALTAVRLISAFGCTHSVELKSLKRDILIHPDVQRILDQWRFSLKKRAR